MDIDKLYFKDLNEGKCETIDFAYYDCKGEERCIKLHRPLPYKQAHPIYAPVFLTETMNATFINKCVKLKKAEVRYKKIVITVDKPLQIGQVIGTDTGSILFRVTKWIKRNVIGSEYNIERLDGKRISRSDFKKLEKAKLITSLGKVK